MNITLPWPPKVLSPNSRIHWAQRAKAVKQYRSQALLLTISALNEGSGRFRAKDGKVEVKLIFNPPNKHRRDLDNCISASKAALDGIADGLGVNDTRFRLTAEIGEPVKHGAVLVSI